MSEDTIKQGVWVLIEGEEGVGKSLCTKEVVARLQAMEHAAIATSEPSQGAVGKLIRECYFAKHRPVDGIPRDLIRSEAFPYLFLADRIDHMSSVVEPALSIGGIVVQDRGFVSTLIHQGGKGDWTWLLALHTQVRRPDAIFILDADAPLIEQRRRTRGDKAYQYRTDEIEFRRSLYLQTQERLPGQEVRVLNAARSLNHIVDEIVRYVEARVSLNDSRDR